MVNDNVIGCSSDYSVVGKKTGLWECNYTTYVMFWDKSQRFVFNTLDKATDYCIRVSGNKEKKIWGKKVVESVK